MAAPVVGKMLADILPYMGVEPVFDGDDAEKMDVSMPQLCGLELHEAVDILEENNLRYRTIGNGDRINAQLPVAGLDIAAGTQVILYLGAQVSQDLETMPRLEGMTYSQARDLLSHYGLYIQSSGAVTDGDKQTVSTQSISAGTQVEHGTVVSVTLVSADESMLGKY